MSILQVTEAVNGATVGPLYAAAVGAVNNLGGGQYSVDNTEYGGSFYDFSNPAVPAGNVVATHLLSYNPALASGIITYQYTYGDGSMPPAFGGLIVGYNSQDILVEQIDGFVPVNKADGTYAGTLDPTHWIIFAATGNNLSLEANGGAGPNLPILFGQTGSFNGLPEPSTFALVPLALLAITVARLPAIRRFFQGRTA
jgi:hypothetical protein